MCTVLASEPCNYCGVGVGWAWPSGDDCDISLSQEVPGEEKARGAKGAGE